MDTLQAYNQSLVLAQEQANYNNTILWILFAIFVITPILFIVVYVPVALIVNSGKIKCPNCGAIKRKVVTEITKDGGRTVSEQSYGVSQV